MPLYDNINDALCNVVLEVLLDVEIIDSDSKISRRLCCLVVNEVVDAWIKWYNLPGPSHLLSAFTLMQLLS